MLVSFTATSNMNLFKEGGNLVAEINLPTFKKDEVKVTIDEGILEVSADHKEEEETKNKRRYFFRESSNRYLSRVTLPENSAPDKAEANFKRGVLRITVPMTASGAKKPKTIAVKQYG